MEKDEEERYYIDEVTKQKTEDQHQTVLLRKKI